MIRDFKSEFPLKYVCTAWQLRKRGFVIAAQGTNCIRKNTKKYEIIPITESLPGRNPGRHTINPLYGLLENRERGPLSSWRTIDTDVARIYGVEEKTISIFSDCARGRGTHDRITLEDRFAYHLGYFFKRNIYDGSGAYNMELLETHCPLRFRDFIFDNLKCSWFN